jgi:hypothetical protein
VTKTVVSIEGDRFLINGQPTYPGRVWKGNRIEGLLFNSRMANALADDDNPATRGVWVYPDGSPWDPERNTNEFCAALPEYRAHGLTAVCINMQGGNPMGYTRVQPWVITGYTETGDLKPDWAARLERVIQATDEQGMVIVLGLFYGWSSRHLKDEEAVRRAVTQTVNWLAERRVRNVLIEIGNEVDHIYYSHRIIEAARCHELIELVKESSTGRFDTPAGRLLAGTSLLHPVAIPDNIVAVSDFLLPHGNWIHGPDGYEQSSPDGIRLQLLRIRASAAYRGQPILYNEDDHFDFHKPDNHLRAAVEGYAGWGLFDFRRTRETFEEGFQSLPVDWRINSTRKRGFFNALKEITGSQ